MPSLNTGNAILSNAIAVNSSYNVGIGGAASSSFKLQVTGTTNLTGALSGTSAAFSGNMAIGGSTITDSNMLNVIGNQSTVNIGVVLNNTNSTHARIYALQNVNGNFNIRDYTASSDRLSISSTGAATFTTANLGHSLTIQNTNSGYYSTSDYLDNAGSEKLIVGYANSGAGALASKAIIYGTSGVGLNFYTNGSTTAKMVIDTNGNVGIGTTDPQSRLQVQGTGGSTGVTLTLANGGSIDAIDNPLGIINFYSNDTSSGASGVFGSISLRNEFGGGWDGNPDREITYMNFSTALGGNVVERMRISNGGQTTIFTSRTNGANINGITLSDTVTGVQTPNFGIRILATSNGGSARSAIALEQDGGTNNDTSIAFYTQFSAASLDRRMTINRSGNILVGSSTADYGYKLAVASGTQHLGVGFVVSNDITSTGRQCATAVNDYSGTSVTFDLASIFPRVTFLNRGLIVTMQLIAIPTYTIASGGFIVLARTGNSNVWSNNILSNININGAAINSVSASGTVITVNYSTQISGTAYISIATIG